MFRPLLRCRLCWRITFTVFGLILLIESVLLIPSAQRFMRTKRQRLADLAQIMVDPLRMRASTERAVPDLGLAIAHYGMRAVAIYGRQGEVLFHAGAKHHRYDAPLSCTMVRPVEMADAGDDLVASWRSDFLGGVSDAKVIAEGVEREEQAAFLRRRRCDEARGYLLDKPVPVAEFEALWLAERATA